MTGIAVLEAQLDGGPLQNVLRDRSGNFVYDPGLPGDGSADCMHGVRLRATDGRTNRSSFLEVTFTLVSETADGSASGELASGEGSWPVSDSELFARAVDQILADPNALDLLDSLLPDLRP